MAQPAAHAWEDIPVASWAELQQALHDDDIVPQRPEQGDHRRSGYVFRGMADVSWPLQTSLERHWPAAAAVEGPALRAFGKYGSEGTMAGESDWQRLSIAQHNGLPTRCLDWTASPLIAAHFATAERQHLHRDGVIWCVQVDTVRDRLVTDAMFATLEAGLAYVFDFSMLNRYWPTLADFDARGEDLLLFFEPPSIDQRIHNQFGLLSVMNGSVKKHEGYLQHHDAELRNDPDQPERLVVRIVIASEAKREIRDMLDQNNITERMLFPGLPGLCDWLRRYYGPS